MEGWHIIVSIEFYLKSNWLQWFVITAVYWKINPKYHRCVDWIGWQRSCKNVEVGGWFTTDHWVIHLETSSQCTALYEIKGNNWCHFCIIFRFWCPDQPTNLENNSCVKMTTKCGSITTWKTYPCYCKLNFICEKKILKWMSPFALSFTVFNWCMDINGLMTFY